MAFFNFGDADAFVNRNHPLVLDADGLRWLAEARPGPREAPWIGTPHPGEAAALLGAPVGDRFAALDDLAACYGGEWILKGAGTLVGPEPLWVSPLAEGALGTAGAGDVLAGVVAGLWAQGVGAPAPLAVHLHSTAAQRAIETCGRGIIASDLLSALGHARGEFEPG